MDAAHAFDLHDRDESRVSHVTLGPFAEPSNDNDAVPLRERDLLWLEENPAPKSWYERWKAALFLAESRGDRAGVREAVAEGARGLCEHDGRARWAFVWIEVYRRRALLSADVTIEALIERARVWVERVDRHRGWAFVWESLLSEALERGDRDFEDRLMALGLSALRAHIGWAFVWQRSIDRATARQDARAVDELCALAATWLREADDEEARAGSWVIQRMFTLRPKSPEFLDGMWSWIARCESHDSWFWVATSALLFDPEATGAVALLERLAAMSLAPAQAARLRETLEALLAQRNVPGALRARVRAILGLPRAANADWEPLYQAWRERRLLRATMQGPREARIDEARVSAMLYDGPSLPVGRALMVKIQHVDEGRGVVRALCSRVLPDATVVAGLVEEGTVQAVVDFGVFVAFREFVGMAHKRNLPEGRRPADYAKGERVCFEVLSADDERIDLRLCDDSTR